MANIQELFDFRITSKTEPDPQEDRNSQTALVPPTGDGVTITPKTVGAAFMSSQLDLGNLAQTEQDLIRKYRELSTYADVDMAIEDIVNAAIANLENEDPITLDLTEVDFTDDVKKAITEEFKKLTYLLEFRERCSEIFRRWYIDGRLFYQKIVTEERAAEGILDIRSVDPRYMRKIREIKKKRDKTTGVELVVDSKEYYIFSEKGLSATRLAQQGTFGANSSMSAPVGKEAITFVPSGLVDPDTNMVLSYLQKAIRPANNLRMMENALVIYRITRAPERRVFYIDTGGLPRNKADEYMNSIIQRYRNKMTFDAETGTVRDDKRFLSMLEDYWLPRPASGKGTEIDVLPGGQNLGDIEDVNYFQRKLYESLNVPISRMEAQTGFSLGREAEISRDELKFVKFVGKLQNKFATGLFGDLLRTQLVLKNVITLEDWDVLKHQIRYKFAQDVFYAEMKQQALFMERANLATIMDPFVDKYFPKSYVQKTVFRFTDEEIAQMEKEMNPEDNTFNREMDLELQKLDVQKMAKKSTGK